ncbi:MAG: FtsX-like permease family protein [Acidobacteria bacterium]|nr:FtsX-like permease family protein [Acidobacteriota bacterium]
MFRLILSNLRRHALRTLLTLLSIGVAFLLYAYLSAISKAFELGIDLAGGDRIVVRNAAGLRLIPLDYEQRIEAIEGVFEAMPLTMFGGIQGERRTTLFNQFPVWPDDFRRVWPEFRITDETLDRWKTSRRGAVVGEKTAKRLDLEPGDRFLLNSPIWPSKTGEAWEFEIVGIYHGLEKETDATHMFFRHDYFEENRASGEGLVLMILVRISDPAESAAIVKAIDAEFANSDAETSSESEEAFLHAVALQIGNVGAIAMWIMGVVFFTILLVAANTMMQSVMERMVEFGLLKAIGFTDLRILTLVVAESTLIALAGGAGGLLTGMILIGRGDPTGGMLPAFFFAPEDIAVGGIIMLILGIVSGLAPALQASRLNPIDALRRE